MTSSRIPYTKLPRAPSEAFPDQTRIDAPALRVHLAYKGIVTPFDILCIIDSGADNCAFPAVIGRRIGIDVEVGKRVSTSGVAGSGITYFHEIEVYYQIDKEITHFPCYAGFMTGLDSVGIGLLGRHGFFNLFTQIAFNNKERFVELMW